ncbi:MAG TPA: phosphoribosylaminoimidazolesuccinocarboxamide synthase [Candidatus Paceibacterota bacterium]|nr:phosphoribosylaminoimidazolesuccinocarboxamide synthase [Candidatus Paceibacterota bacterium]
MPKGDFIASGKTKELRVYNDTNAPAIAEVKNLDDLTAGNGAKHDVLPGKGTLATTTTCNVFEYLQKRGVRIAYQDRTGLQTFLAVQCRMIPLEVVTRRVADGSYLKRNPAAKKGSRFATPVVELYLKTKDQKWVGKDGVEHALPVDDPLLVRTIGKDGFGVHDPRKPVDPEHPLFRIPLSDVDISSDDLLHIETMAMSVFKMLEGAWWFAARGTLKDMKIEFGWGIDLERPPAQAKLYVADVIDNDSWRLEISGKEVSKEIYRQGAPLDEVLKAYELVARFSEKFRDHLLFLKSVAAEIE